MCTIILIVWMKLENSLLLLAQSWLDYQYVVVVVVAVVVVVVVVMTDGLRAFGPILIIHFVRIFRATIC